LKATERAPAHLAAPRRRHCVPRRPTNVWCPDQYQQPADDGGGQCQIRALKSAVKPYMNFLRDTARFDENHSARNYLPVPLLSRRDPPMQDRRRGYEANSPYQNSRRSASGRMSIWEHDRLAALGLRWLWSVVWQATHDVMSVHDFDARSICLAWIQTRHTQATHTRELVTSLFDLVGKPLKKHPFSNALHGLRVVSRWASQMLAQAVDQSGTHGLQLFFQ